MTEIRTEAVPLIDGGSLRLTVAEPDGVVRGGIVVLHEARGVTEAVRALVGQFADEGWLTVAPHLYHRDGADELDGDEGSVRDQVQRLDRQQIIDDSDTAFGWLSDHDITTDRLGVVGFDLGGAVALMVAASRTLGAAASVMSGLAESKSGREKVLIEAAEGLTCPWLGIFGEVDSTNEVVERLREAAKQSEVATDVVVYPGTGHRVDADPDAAAEVWQRTLNWFDSHLR